MECSSVASTIYCYCQRKNKYQRLFLLIVCPPTKDGAGQTDCQTLFKWMIVSICDSFASSPETYPPPLLFFFCVSRGIQINHKTFSHHSSAVPKESELNLIIYATSFYFCRSIWSLNPSQSLHSLTW